MIVKDAIVGEVTSEDLHIITPRPLAGPNVFTITQNIQGNFVAVYKIHNQTRFLVRFI
jgi:hypothetical protein